MHHKGTCFRHTPKNFNKHSGNIIRKFRGHDLKINTVLFAGEDSSVVISGSYDKTVRIFDCRSRSFEAMQVFCSSC